jgi:alpha-ketoglutarate-dependent taurine dioxygenase
VEQQLARHGALLFRAFVCGQEQLEDTVRGYSDELFEYSYRSTPRRTVEGRIYTSTEYPPDQTIPLHNEMSYARRWPRRLWFLCVRPADEGGATPLADSREVLAALDPEVRDRFIARGVEYRRNYGPYLDLSWQEAFQTDDPAVVAERCREQRISFAWTDDGRLLTRAVRPAVVTHPVTGEAVWFNQAHLFHAANLPAAVRASLAELVQPDHLPRGAFFGDGSPIEDTKIREIEGVYEDLAYDVRWQAGDVVLIDNLLMAHGRRPFAGERRVLVAMSEAHCDDDGG